jgi:hypothetical protein
MKKWPLSPRMQKEETRFFFRRTAGNAAKLGKSRKAKDSLKRKCASWGTYPVKAPWICRGICIGNRNAVGARSHRLQIGPKREFRRTLHGIIPARFAKKHPAEGAVRAPLRRAQCKGRRRSRDQRQTVIVSCGDGETPFNPSGTVLWPRKLSPQATTVPSDLSARL